MIFPKLYSFLSQTAYTRRAISHYYYLWIAPFLDRAEFSFMNYGFAEVGDQASSLALPEADEPHRLPIQLYHHMASAITLDGKDVLEVSCGRGGGAAFLTRQHQPRSYTGIDRTSRSIDYCQRKHSLPSLSFMQGDAEAMCFQENSFDVVLSVEASHLYGHFHAFLSETHRVLRQGGYLLLADKRDVHEIAMFQQTVSNSGLKVINHQDISANVLRSIHLQRANRVQVLHRHLPYLMALIAIHMVGADGSHLYHGMLTGRTVYFFQILRKV